MTSSRSATIMSLHCIRMKNRISAGIHCGMLSKIFEVILSVELHQPFYRLMCHFAFIRHWGSDMTSTNEVVTCSTTKSKLVERRQIFFVSSEWEWVAKNRGEHGVQNSMFTRWKASQGFCTNPDDKKILSMAKARSTSSIDGSRRANISRECIYLISISLD